MAEGGRTLGRKMKCHIWDVISLGCSETGGSVGEMFSYLDRRP
jgi:hypothetical protein